MATYEWRSLEKSLWLQDQSAGPKDFDVRAAIAAEYSQRFGCRVELVKCVPHYGPFAGQFWGYNIIDTGPGEGVYFERELICQGAPDGAGGEG